MKWLPVAFSISCGLVLSSLACSSDDAAVDPGGTGGSTGQDGGGGGAQDGGGGCASRDFEPTPLGAGEDLVDVAASGASTWLLLRSKDGALAVQEVGKERRVLEARDATGSAIATRPDGTVCALWGVGARGAAKVKTACAPAFDIVDTGVTLAMSRDYPIAYRDEGASGAAVLFAETNSLDGIARTGLGAWRDANVMESSISFAGGPRALSGATEGSPVCFVSQGGIVVERWGRSGSLNTIGSIRTESGATFYGDVGCAVAVQGAAVGVFAVGKGKGTFAIASAAPGGKLEPTPLEAKDITSWGFGATRTHFVAVYAADGNLFRARRPVAGGAVEITPVALPSGATADGKVAVTWDASGTEHLAASTKERVLVAKTCAAP